MKLVVSMMVGPGELDRYLRQTVPHALGYADELVALVDDPDGDAFEWLDAMDGVVARRRVGARFFEHEGAARQELLSLTFEREPSHVLALDADELIPHGAALRAHVDWSTAAVWLLKMVEMWDVRSWPWRARVDGGWAPTWTSCVYRVPPPLERAHPSWAIQPRQLACGREPLAVVQVVRAGRAEPVEIDVLHLGWADPAEREQRARRYLERDGGEFHARWHLDSILWPEERCQLVDYHGCAGAPVELPR